MTGREITNALAEVCDHCDELMDGYVPISLRASLKYLGYDRVQQDEVIHYCALNGFNHCIDPIITSTGIGIAPEYPAAQVCRWGPDQLKSRVQCVRPPKQS